MEGFAKYLKAPMFYVGVVGQVAFFSRFLVQWIVSERKGESSVPTSFWYLSICGGVMLMAYAIWDRDPIIILGQSVGLLVYARNLVLIRRKQAAEE